MEGRRGREDKEGGKKRGVGREEGRKRRESGREEVRCECDMCCVLQGWRRLTARGRS